MLHILVIAIVAALSAVATSHLWASAVVTLSFAAIVLIVVGIVYGETLALYGGIVVALLCAGAAAGAARTGVFRLPGTVPVKYWRIIARPFALLFVPIDIHLGPRFTVVLIGIVALVFIAGDLVRMLSRMHSTAIYTERERKRFSSMTAFLVAVFIVFLVFPQAIAYLALGFLTVGDMYGKLLGIRFARVPLIGGRTLSGSLGFVTGSLIAGYVIYLFVPYPVVFLFVGAPVAAAIELFSTGFDDNFTVGILSGVVLYVLRVFFGA